MDSLVTALEKEGIKSVLKQNKKGIIYVDHRTKCVFNGSDLGKQYSAKGIEERCNRGETAKPNEGLLHHHTTKHQEPNK